MRRDYRERIPHLVPQLVQLAYVAWLGQAFCDRAGHLSSRIRSSIDTRCLDYAARPAGSTPAASPVTALQAYAPSDSSSRRGRQVEKRSSMRWSTAVRPMPANVTISTPTNTLSVWNVA